MLTIAFDQEVNLELETLFSTFPAHVHIPDYIKYYTSMASDGNGQDDPVFSICSYCKSILNQKTGEWDAVEHIISDLPRNAKFSHSICPPCAENLQRPN